MWVFARLARFFNRANQPEIAATLHGATTHQHAGLTTPFANLTAFVDHLRTVLGASVFDTCTATGAAMELDDAVAYAHHHIHTTRTQHTTPP